MRKFLVVLDDSIGPVPAGDQNAPGTPRLGAFLAGRIFGWAHFWPSEDQNIRRRHYRAGLQIGDQRQTAR